MGIWTCILGLHLMLGSGPLTASPAHPAELATYVPVCKNSRGVFDRRACGSKADRRRSQLA